MRKSVGEALRDTGRSNVDLARAAGEKEARMSEWRRDLAVPSVEKRPGLAQLLGIDEDEMDRLVGETGRRLAELRRRLAATGRPAADAEEPDALEKDAR